MASRTDRECAQCGEAFGATSRLLSICTSSCRAQWNLEHDPLTSARPRVCVECGTGFSANKNGKACSGECQDALGARLKRESHERNKEANNRRSREHSRKVRKEGYVPPGSRAKARRTHECAVCHQEFTSGPGAKFCSYICKALDWTGPRAIYGCIECGRAHIGWRGRDVCGDECKKIHNAKTKASAPSGSAEYKREYGIQYRKDNIEHLREQKRLYDLRYPERKRDSRRRSKGYRNNAPKGVPYSQDGLLRTQGNRCHLCGQTMDLTKGTKGSPWTVSIDHVLPLSLGGLDCRTNVKLAHSRCNIKKHNRTMAELEGRGLLPMPGPSREELLQIRSSNEALASLGAEYAS